MNILLLIDSAIAFFGLCAFLLAFSGTTIGESTLLFGGDRWTTDEGAPFFKRITARGWFSILCLLAVIGLVVGKQALKEQMDLDEVATRIKVEGENTILREQITKHIENILVLQKESGRANQTLSGINEEIEAHHLLAMQAAFMLTFKPSRDKDEAIVQIDGRDTIPIPSRFRDQMVLVGGDQFYFATFIENASALDLQMLQLELGDKRYPLFEGPVQGFFERTLRLPGNPILAVPAVISNPLGLRNIWLKIFVRPKDVIQEDEVFKSLILESPFSKEAKKKYKITTADMLNVRSMPSPSAVLVSRLPRGSFVQKIQENNAWLEVKTAEGKQGWVTRRFVSEIE